MPDNKLIELIEQRTCTGCARSSACSSRSTSCASSRDRDLEELVRLLRRRGREPRQSARIGHHRDRHRSRRRVRARARHRARSSIATHERAAPEVVAGDRERGRASMRDDAVERLDRARARSHAGDGRVQQGAARRQGRPSRGARLRARRARQPSRRTPRQLDEPAHDEPRRDRRSHHRGRASTSTIEIVEEKRPIEPPSRAC